MKPNTRIFWWFVLFLCIGQVSQVSAKHTALYKELYHIHSFCVEKEDSCYVMLDSIYSKVAQSEDLESKVFWRFIRAENHFHFDRYQICIDSLLPVAQVAKLNNYSYISRSALRTIGDCYRNMENYYLALKYYQEAFEWLHEKKGSGYFMLGNRMGIVYSYIAEYDKAIEWYTDLIAHAHAEKDTFHIKNLSGSLSRVYANKGDYSMSLTWAKKASEIAHAYSESDEIMRGSANYVLGVAYRENGNCKESIQLIEQHLPFLQKHSSSDHYFNFQLMDCYAKLGNVEKADYYYQQGKVDADKEEEAGRDLGESYLILCDYYKYKGNFEAALVAHKKYLDYQLELEKGDKMRQTLMLRNEFEVRLKQAEINELAQSNKANTLLIRQRNLMIFSLLGLLLLGSIIAYLIFRERNFKAKSDMELLEQKLLRSQMNPHFIFNTVSVIQSLILSNENKRASKYLTRFSRLMRVILENSAEKFVSLKSEIDAIEDYIALQLIRFDESFAFELSIAPSIDTEDILVPPMLIQPFVENAIEHGIRKVEDGKIKVSIVKKNGYLFCEVDDNGVGLTSDAIKQTGIGYKTKSLSTKITKARLSHFSKEMDIPAALTISNKLDEGKQGTHVSLLLPFK